MSIYITDEELIAAQVLDIDLEEAETEATIKAIDREYEDRQLADEDWAEQNGYIIPEKPCGKVL
jgi:hypothetical protein